MAFTTRWYSSRKSSGSEFSAVGQFAFQSFDVGLQRFFFRANLLLHFRQFVFGLGDAPFVFRHEGLQDVELFHRFENFVGQHAVGHFVGGDLILQGLIFAIGVGLVQLDLQLGDFAFAGFQLQLLLIHRHAAGFQFAVQFRQLFFGLGHGGGANSHLFRTTIQPIAQIGQLPMNSVQLSERAAVTAILFSGAGVCEIGKERPVSRSMMVA